MTESSLERLRALRPSSLTSEPQSPVKPSRDRLPTLATIQEKPGAAKSRGLNHLPTLPNEARLLRVLDFDIENRPLSYGGGDWTTAEVTAIAAGWVDEDEVHCWALGQDSSLTMFREFMRLYDQADIVTGHNIRRHDLPILNGAMLEAGLPFLTPKLSCDTYGDLLRRGDISGSQESLAGMLGIRASKYHMSQPMWRSANRLTPEGVQLTKKRVIDDVIQHKALRARLIEIGALKPPKVWKP